MVEVECLPSKHKVLSSNSIPLLPPHPPKKAMQRIINLLSGSSVNVLFPTWHFEKGLHLGSHLYSRVIIVF
jgi:hypothetical protein